MTDELKTILDRFKKSCKESRFDFSEDEINFIKLELTYAYSRGISVGMDIAFSDSSMDGKMKIVH